MKSRNNKDYQIIALALFLMFALRYVPAVFGLSASGMQVIGIFLGVLILWLTISIDWPSILLLGALALVPELNFSSILSISYGNTTFVFLLFTFILTYALGKTSYLRRIALGFITSKLAKKGPWWFVVLYCASIIFLGMFISPTVLFFVYLPILEEICALLNIKKGEKFGALLMMATVIMCGISSGMTPIAHVFPLISMGLYSDMYATSIDYARFMIVAVPMGLLTAIGTMLVFRFLFRPNLHHFQKNALQGINSDTSKTTTSEKIILAIFIMVVLLWVAPGLLLLFIKDGPFFDFLNAFDALGTAFPPLIGIVSLCIIRVDDKPLLNIGEAMAKGVSWPSLVMCAGTLAIGSALTNTDIGITSWLSSNLSEMITSLPSLVMVLIFAIWATLQTNLSSNMVTATVVTTAALSITQGLNDISIPGLVIIIGALASYAFATPPAMPCVAIAASSGWTNTIQMMIYGFIAMIISIVFATVVAYPLALLVF